MKGENMLNLCMLQGRDLLILVLFYIKYCFSLTYGFTYITLVISQVAARNLLHPFFIKTNVAYWKCLLYLHFFLAILFLVVTNVACSVAAVRQEISDETDIVVSFLELISLMLLSLVII
jgi:hypothetical protein